MKNLLPLMQREWLQHRYAWALLVLVPMALSVLPLAFGSIELDGMPSQQSASELALLVGLVTLLVTTAVLFLLFWLSSLFIAIATPRRDHADRSVEFWLSLPTGHGESLAAPMLVHLLLVPAAALVVGLGCGVLMSFITVGRVAGLGEWLGLPWGTLVVGMLSVVARLLAGLPLATLWLLPLLLAAMLANAYFKRWGLPVLITALSLGSAVLQIVFGQPLVTSTVLGLLTNGGKALMGASGSGLQITSEHPADIALAELPAWALRDLGAALQALASPLFMGAVLVSAGLFYGLVLWRQRGAGAQG